MRAELARVPVIEPKQSGEELSLGEVLALKPASNPPFILAVAPPFSQYTEELPSIGRKEVVVGEASYRPWTRAEQREIESWTEELRRLGLVRDLVIMPILSTELDGAQSALAGLRVAGARHHADAILVVSESERTSTWLNLRSILDLTVIGAWFVRGHEFEVVSMLEGALVDTRTGYLFGTGQAEGSARSRRALADADEPSLREKARRRALADMKRQLLRRAGSLTTAEPVGTW